MPKFKPRKPYQRNKKAIGYNFAQYDAKHRQQIQQRAQKVTQLYNQVVAKLCNSAERSLFDADPADEFRWQDYPALAKECNALLRDLGTGLNANLQGAVDDAWQLANTKNDGFIKSLAKRTTIPAATMEKWNAKNLDALDKLNKRIEKGMNLSDGTNNPFGGVWNLGQFKQELEISLQVCMGQGMSAQDMSREVRNFLKYPVKLFRRVRDEHGVLRLSKAAQAFHPGAGVYRSSYKNALRLTATENNIAYRTADHERWKKMDVIIGQQVILSNNHPVTDICDQLSAEYQGQEDRGRYPKDFKFTGWHPWCRCYVVPLMPSDEELDAYLAKVDAGEDTSNMEFADEVKEMPDKFNEWVGDNQKRIEDAAGRGKLPYFLKDNPKQMERALELAKENSEKKAKDNSQDASAENSTPQPLKKTAKEIAAERHAARTPEEAEAIRWKWNDRVFTPEQLAHFDDIEKALGVKRGFRMTDEQADEQNANPNYWKNAAYRDNCQTCCPTFQLRKWGFDVTARQANDANKKAMYLMERDHWKDVYLNSDGSKAIYTSIVEWKEAQGVTAKEFVRKDGTICRYTTGLTKQDFYDYASDICKEDGLYEMGCAWAKGGGHCTLILRENGVLYNIEPQIFEGTLKQNIDSLFADMRDIATTGEGIMRIDDKKINIEEYKSIFKKPRKK